MKSIKQTDADSPSEMKSAQRMRMADKDVPRPDTPMPARESTTSRELHTGSNAQFQWNEFDSGFYYDHNYSTLRADDREILELVRDFFDAHPVTTVDAIGIDVGSGTNLYPTFAMLPFCRTVTLWEYSEANINWLEQEVRDYSPSWNTFWEILARKSHYKAIREPRQEVAGRASVRRGSVFDLPQAKWHIGTMFFVAESISTRVAEFEQAIKCFVRALRPGAPFAAAFMENSAGYHVGEHRFPAVAVNESTVKDALADYAPTLEINRIDLGSDPIRDGYSGMILARGITTE
jgi:hypothetical protein